jgi:methylmalonyl-CoA mutase cobalamin-binding subunit
VTLSALHGTAAMQLMGFSSAESRRSFERALALLEDVPQHPLRGLFLSVLGLVYHMRAEREEAAAVARRSEALWNASGDRTALVCACLVQGLLEHDRGRPVVARGWLEKGIDAVRHQDASTSPAVFTADAGVLMLGMLALELHHLGLVDQAQELMQAACGRALALAEPAPRQAAFWLEAMFEVRRDHPERVADAAERLARVQEEYDAPEGKAAALWFRGWAQARLGDPRGGHRLIRDGYDQVARIGMRAFAGETLGYAAEALLLAGDAAAAHCEVAAALQCADATGDRHCLPRLLMIDARVAQALGEDGRARKSLQQAVSESRSQEATWPELLARSALCERGDATREDLAALGSVVEHLSEGLETPAVARARELLGKGALAGT